MNLPYNNSTSERTMLFSSTRKTTFSLYNYIFGKIVYNYFDFSIFTIFENRQKSLSEWTKGVKPKQPEQKHT